MRQAGSHLPDHRELYEQYGVRTLATTPELNIKVTLLPVQELGVDAAVMYADIILPLEDMGIEFHYGEGETGPVIHNSPRSPDDIDDLRVLNPERGVPFFLETIRQVRRELDSDKALVGFSGGPFTLAGYIIEGTASRTYPRTKTFMRDHPGAFSNLLETITDSMIRYWSAQAEAGVDVLQLFESWMGALTPRNYRDHVLPHTRRLFEETADLGVPTINFGTNLGALVEEFAEPQADALSPGWRTPLDQIAEQAGTNRPVQTNLDPSWLLGDPDRMKPAVDEILRQADSFPGSVFNTGHRIPLNVKPDTIRELVNYVHERTTD